MTSPKLRPNWRTMLFVPAHIPKFVAKAHDRGADAAVLDLEDSVPPAMKAEARAAARAAAGVLAAGGMGVLVRVNADTWREDADAVVGPAVHALVLPKVENAAFVQDVSAHLNLLEAGRGMEPGQTWLLLQIEDVRALPHLDAIAAAGPRVLGLSLGSEDFSASAGMVPVPEALLWPNQMVQFACQRAGVLPFGFPASIADFADQAAFRRHAQLARQLGFVGALCIHPSQVAPLNEAFSPTNAEVEEAHGVIDAYEQALREGRGAAQYRSKMVDLPVVARARALLRRVKPQTFENPEKPNEEQA